MRKLLVLLMMGVIFLGGCGEKNDSKTPQKKVVTEDKNSNKKDDKSGTENKDTANESNAQVNVDLITIDENYLNILDVTLPALKFTKVEKVDLDKYSPWEKARVYTKKFGDLSNTVILGETKTESLKTYNDENKPSENTILPAKNNRLQISEVKTPRLYTLTTYDLTTGKGIVFQSSGKDEAKIEESIKEGKEIIKDFLK